LKRDRQNAGLCNRTLRITIFHAGTLGRRGMSGH
jgi:hypothetical protein